MRNSILLLDEPLRGLDNASTQHIIQRIFSDSGLLRRHHATIVMVTSSSESNKAEKRGSETDSSRNYDEICGWSPGNGFQRHHSAKI